ncbi:MAG: sugar transferase [Eubacterium sp.]|nr:sugar transferase [Eubacterium sp.]
MKKRRLEFIITIFVYIVSALLAGLLAEPAAAAFHKLSDAFIKSDFFFDVLLPILLSEALAIVLGLSRRRYSFGEYSAAHYFWISFRGTMFLGGIWAIVLLMQRNDISRSRYYFGFTLAFHFILLWILLYVVQQIVIRKYYQTSYATFVGVVTNRAYAAKAVSMIKGDWSRRVVAIALTDEDVHGINYNKISMEDDRLAVNKNLEYIDHVPVIAGANTLRQWAQKSPLDEIFIFSDDTETDWVQQLILIFTKMGIPVYANVPSMQRLSKVLRDRNQRYLPRVREHFSFMTEEGGRAINETTAAEVAEGSLVPLIAFAPHEMSISGLFAKRVLDVIGGLVGSVIAVILTVILGIAIKIDSPGPVFFSQERVGQNGRKFKMYKFRSMYKDAEARKAELMKQNEMNNGLMFKMKEDPRITRVGKFIRKTSLDEFPQFFNVLKGDMSLVGTRPPTVAEFQKYRDYHKRRLSMKPGITGMWQVSGRSEITDFEEVVRLDCEYIDNWSMGLDFKILVKTIGAVFTGKGSE